MLKQILKFRVVIVLCLIIVLCSSEAFAWGGGRGSHYYRDGRWYRHGWLWFDTAVAALTIGALVDSIPPRYTTVVYGGVPYYYYDNAYYRPYPAGGYIVVPPPAVAQPVMIAPEMAQPVVAAPVYQQTAPSQPQIPDTLTVNIPNSKGGYTAVMLKRSGNGFVGPQGEYYPEHPTVDQLKVLYGK